MRFSFGPILALLIAALGVALDARRSPAVFTPAGVLFTDPDDYMHLYRARELLEGRERLIKNMPEINWPKGAELHWTAPMDYLLVGTTKAVGPFLGGSEQERLDIIAAWMPVALGAVYSICLMAFLARACGWPLALLIGAAAVCVPPFHRPFALGHPDHHCLLEVLYLLAVLLWIPKRASAGLRGIPGTGPALASGLFMGMALWVAPQSMAVWLAILAGTTIATYHATPEARAIWTTRRFEWNCGVFAAVAVGFLVENWPKVSSASIDKISVFHLALILLAFLNPSGSVAYRAETAYGRFIHSLHRWPLLAAGLVLFAAWMVMRADRIFGPMSSPEYRRSAEHIAELQPLWTRAGGAISLAQLHARLGWLAYALPAAAWFFIRNKMMPCGAKLTICLLAIGFTVLSVMQRRWLDHVTLGLMVVTVIGVWELVRGILARQALDSVGRRVLITIVLVAALLLPTYRFVFDFSKPLSNPVDLRTATVAQRILEYESRQPASGSKRAILCAEGDGPMLLYRTRLPIVAGPYHRAIEGIVAAARFYAERDEAAALRQLERLDVRYVVVPLRPHEQLMNYEWLAFDELRSFDPPTRSINEQGALREELHYRPGITQTMAYRLAMEPDRAPAQLRCIAKSREGAATPDGYSGLLYFETATPAPGPGRHESEL